MTDRASATPDVAVIITTYNHAQYLADAIASVLAQDVRAREVIVVDDGSTDDPASVVKRFADVTLIRQANGGLAAARNTGMGAAQSDLLIFLDADDKLLPNAIVTGLDCLSRNPGAAFVYGGHRRIDREGRCIGPDRYSPIGPDAYSQLLTGNYVGMHAAVLYDRQALVRYGGFDPALKRCEDYDVYLRLSRTERVASHPDIVAEYRWHGENMSRRGVAMLRWALRVHGRQEAQARARQDWAESWRRGQAEWREYYFAERRAELHVLRSSASGMLPMMSASWDLVQIWPARAMEDGARSLKRKVASLLPSRWRDGIAIILGGRSAPPVGGIEWGDFDRVTPIDPDFGFGRGLPIDRFYVEAFLERNAMDIQGRVLEIGDDSYCRRFGGSRVVQQDVLHVEQDAPGATIVGDLSQAGVLPSAAFDCMVLTQTLHLIFDLAAAVRQIHDALKPGGILLLTVPGVSQIDRGAWRDSWYWSLSPIATRRLVGSVFGEDNVQVEAVGNVLAATAFLHGVAVHELDVRKLWVVDPAYPMIVTLRARRVA